MENKKSKFDIELIIDLVNNRKWNVKEVSKVIYKRQSPSTLSRFLRNKGYKVKFNQEIVPLQIKVKN